MSSSLVSAVPTSLVTQVRVMCTEPVTSSHCKQ
jgi:hypothetical protein